MHNLNSILAYLLLLQQRCPTFPNLHIGGGEGIFGKVFQIAPSTVTFFLLIIGFANFRLSPSLPAAKK